jgi:uncharacterized protein YndB with AHSA1/START domain
MQTQELKTIKTINTPIEKMWEVWTNPDHLVKWWGPNGFTNTIHQMDLKKGGEWKMTMHGPDGTNFPNRSIFLEIIPNEKIVFEHFNPHFITTLRFESVDSGTKIEWSMLFDSPEMYEIVVKAHKADEGQKQNLEKIGEIHF